MVLTGTTPALRKKSTTFIQLAEETDLGLDSWVKFVVIVVGPKKEVSDIYSNILKMT